MVEMGRGVEETYGGVGGEGEGLAAFAVGVHYVDVVELEVAVPDSEGGRGVVVGFLEERSACIGLGRGNTWHTLC
jgi:hypothetical protein